MTLQSKTALSATVAANITDNTTGSNTPALHRTVENNIIDGIWSIVSVAIDDGNSPYTVDCDAVQLVIADSSSAGVTINLPAVASSANKYLTVKHVGSSNNVVLDGNGSETIDGATTHTLSTQYDVVRVYCDGSAWHVISN
jgi:hypothetical protein